MKKVINKIGTPNGHWVGNGFPVRSMFSYDTIGKQASPFLLLDYAGPYDFTPIANPRGVGSHPHRGFETVTIVYQGELEHRDSTGSGGRIGPGDVQWMTAASGILHEETHSAAFSQNGGTLQMVQLWVNLPAANKMSSPGYQTLLKADIPVIQLIGNSGSVRIIAGRFDGVKGAASTHTPIDVLDVQLEAHAKMRLDLRDGWTSMLFVLTGSVRVNRTETLKGPVIGLLDKHGDHVLLEAQTDVVILVLSGEPIDEPIVGYGPFVMNSQAQIDQALKDYQSGVFGTM